ncbi:MAG: DUF3307 domain-containing protein [Candidatus Margulisbacteria bacterium]|nr:DUF3307 domain-containing protein [Candidatus Margulisiibacteriota bacterium]
MTNALQLNLFILLWFSHALADFPLQTNTIFRLKVKHIWGIFVHALIFLAIAIVFTYPVSIKSLLFIIWLIVVFLSHVLFDKIKLVFSHNIIQKELQYFILDQLLHIGALATIFLLPLNLNPTLLEQNIVLQELQKAMLVKDLRTFIVYAFVGIIFIYATYAIDVILYYYDRTINTKLQKLKYNLISMFYRGLIVLLFITSFYWLSILLIPVNYFINKMTLIYDKRRFIIESTLIIILLMTLMIGSRGLL